MEQWGVPLNPFMLFDYFFLDTIDRDIVREANNNVVLKSDEIRVFGPVSNWVLAEVKNNVKANDSIVSSGEKGTIVKNTGKYPTETEKIAAMGQI